VINEEGNGYDAEVAARVKDGMREHCLAQVADAWLSILQLSDTAPALVAMCLHTVHLYVSWIPIGLITSAQWLMLLQQFLRTPLLHDGACLVLAEVVTKRMEPVAKVDHLTQLGMAVILEESVAAGESWADVRVSCCNWWCACFLLCDCEHFWARLFTATHVHGSYLTVVSGPF